MSREEIKEIEPESDKRYMLVEVDDSGIHVKWV